SIPLDQSLDFNPSQGVLSRACNACFETFEQWQLNVTSATRGLSYHQSSRGTFGTLTSSFGTTTSSCVSDRRRPLPPSVPGVVVGHGEMKKNLGAIPDGFLGPKDEFGRDDIVFQQSRDIAIKARSNTEHEVDGEVLLDHLNDDALKNEFGFKVYGARCKILNRIKQLKGESSLGSPVTTVGDTESPLISRRMAGLNIGFPVPPPQPTSMHLVSDIDYSALDEQEPLAMLESPLQLHLIHHSGTSSSSDYGDEDSYESDNDMQESDNSGGSEDANDSDAHPIKQSRPPASQPTVSISTSPSMPTKKRIAPMLVSSLLPANASSGLKSQSEPSELQATNVIVHRTSPTAMTAGSEEAVDQTKSPTTVLSPKPPATKVIRRVAPSLVHNHMDSSSALNDIKSPQQNTPGTGKGKKGSPYLPQLGLSLAQIFYNQDGTRLESGSENEEWIMKPTPSQRKMMQPGFKRLVQQNLRRIFRDPPIFDLPDRMVYAPAKRNERDVPVTTIAKSKRKPVIAESTWDKTFQSETSTSTVRVELDIKDMASFDFKAATQGRTSQTTESIPALPENAEKGDFLYPVYGESDASAYTTDEDLYWEVEKEQQEKTSRQTKARPRKVSVSPTAVENLVKQYITERSERWAKIEGPKKAQQWRNYIDSEPNIRAIALERLTNEIEYEEARIKKASESIMTIPFNSSTEVLKACSGAMEYFIDNLCVKRWEFNVISNPNARPTPPPEETADTLAPKSTAPRPTRERARSIDPEEKRQRELDKAFIVDDDEDEYGDAGTNCSESSDRDSEMDEADRRTKPRPPRPRPAKKLQQQPTITEIVNSDQDMPLREATPLDAEMETVGDELSKPDIPPVIEVSEAKPRIEPTQQSVKEPKVEGSKKKKNKWTKGPKTKYTIAKSTKFANVDVIVLDDDTDDDKAIADKSKDKDSAQSASNRSTNKRQKTSISRLNPQHVVWDQSSDDRDKVDVKQEDRESRDREDVDKRNQSIATHHNTVSGEGEESSARQEMQIPNWMDQLDMSKLSTYFREFRHRRCRLERIRESEPILSAYQEYIEWIELDVEDNLSISKFVAWKQAGHTTHEYRKRAAIAAKVLAEVEEKERREKAKRDRMRREREKEKEKEKQEKKEKESLARARSESQEPQGSITRSSSSTSQPTVFSINDESDQDEEMAPAPASEDVDIGNDDQIIELNEVKSKKRDENTEENDTDTTFKTKATARRKRKKISSISGESSSDSDIGPLIFKRRLRTRHFGDTDSGGSVDEHETETEPETKEEKKKPVSTQPMKDEAAHVLRIRADAAKNELELQKRIKEQERRGLINSTLDPTKVGATLVNKGHKKTERSVPIPDFLLQHLKPHQIDGIQFMWKNVVMFDNGCILAHSMGLGKTFQVVSLVYILLNEIQAGNRDIPGRLKAGRVMLLLPPTVLDNWEEEFGKWIPEDEQHVVNVQRFPAYNNKREGRLAYLENWYTKGGVFLISYDMFRSLCDAKDVSPDELDRFRTLLLKPGPSIVICDEGHQIKNADAKTSMAASRINTTTRVILTGYPLQNRLEEYWCMVDFVWPNFLGDIATFRHNYIRPIKEGLYSESSIFNKNVSAKKLKVLTELIKNFVLR
ncbi:hypothetical protein BG004_002899, partial [Podila humilis]